MALILPGPELQKHIMESLNENVDTRERDLDIIKIWLRQQPHLPDTWEDQILLSFLRGTNFRLELCKQKIDMYFTMRTAAPEFFSNRDINDPILQKVIEYGDAAILPGLTPLGHRVTLLRATQIDFDSAVPDIGLGMKVMLMAGDVRMLEEKTGVAGDVYILDASVATARNFATVSPGVIKKFLVCIQEAYPMKLKQVHVINLNSFVQVIYNWIRPFLKEKIKGRIYMHASLEGLYEHVPRAMLPEEYGGDAGKIRTITDSWIIKLRQYGPWFREQEKLKADESKRPGKSINYDELFGMDGSFKKLNVD